MNWFFDEQKNCEALFAELKLWKGTRFAPGKGERGVVADCVRFVAGVMVNIGAFRFNEWPAYTCFGGGEKIGRLLHGLLKAAKECREVTGSEFMIGDLCEFSSGKRHHHVAIFTGNNTVKHCIHGYGICDGNIRDPMLAKNLRSVFRFITL